MVNNYNALNCQFMRTNRAAAENGAFFKRIPTRKVFTPQMQFPSQSVIDARSPRKRGKMRVKGQVSSKRACESF